MYVDWSNFCGGSLISNMWVLTAGHCTTDAGSITMYFGTTSLSPGAGQVVIESQSITTHPDYNPDNLNNDLGLIQLAEAIQFSNKIYPVLLPLHAYQDFTFENMVLRVSGWGLTSDSATTPSPNLNYIDVTVISNTACADIFGDLIVDTTLCALGSNGQSICQGDSGGPLVLGSGAEAMQFGVVSFVSSEGCEHGSPNGYARLTKFLDWISTTTGITIP